MSNPANQSSLIGNSARGGGFLFSVFPATINTADPAALTDGNVSMLSMDASGRLRSVVSPASGITFTMVPFTADAVGATGRVTSPAANAAICTIAAASLATAGLYSIQVLVALDLGAPVAATDTNNMELRAGATVISVLQLLPVINVYGPVRRFQRTLDGATALTVNATAAGTAGVGYSAELVAVRVA